MADMVGGDTGLEDDFVLRVIFFGVVFLRGISCVTITQLFENCTANSNYRGTLLNGYFKIAGGAHGQFCQFLFC